MHRLEPSLTAQMSDLAAHLHAYCGLAHMHDARLAAAADCALRPRAQQTAKDVAKEAGLSESDDEGGDEGIRRVEPGAAANAAANAANAATAAANMAVREHTFCQIVASDLDPPTACRVKSQSVEWR